MNKWQNEVQKSLLASEEAAIKELEKQYKKALKDINEKVKLFDSDIKLLQEAINADGLDEAAKAVLQSQQRSKIYQKQYQEALQGQVSGILDNLHGAEYATIEKYLKDCYTDSYVGTMYDIAHQGIPVIMPIDQAAVVKAVLTDSKVSKGLYNALGVNVKKLKKTITQEVSRGIATGLAYNDIARNISNAAKAPLSRAKTIARTEGHRIQVTSTADAQKAAKAKGADVVKQWDSTLDGKTRDSHRRVDGEIRELDEKFSNGLRQPGDSAGGAAEVVNCRCALLTRARWALDEDELKTLEDRAKYFGLDKTKNFEEYKEKYLKAAESPVVQTPVFIPAKTIEEAEEYAQKFVSKYKGKYSGNVSYKGLSVDSANTINETLNDMYSRFELPELRNIQPMNFREKIWKDSKDTPMAYRNMGVGDLYFNPKILKDSKSLEAYFAEGERAYKICVEQIDKFTGSTREMVERYIKAGRSLVADDAKNKLMAMVQHEMGHHIQNQLLLHDQAAVDIVKEGFEKYAIKISGYATKSHGEYIAESFCAYMNGEAQKIDPALVKYFQARTGANVEKALAKSKVSDNVISEIRTFTKGSKDFPTVQLPKQEYAHVMSEIATHLTAEQESKAVFKKAVGKYIYTVENNGFGNYRVIGKELIDTDKFE